MAVILREARSEDRSRLERLLADYLFEFDGQTEPYRYLDAYWEEPQRLALLIENDGELVGFCLIRRRDDGWSIAEFGVVAAQRRAGIGRAAVDELAARAQSERASYLEAKVHPGKAGALAFWLAVGFSKVEAPGAGVTVTRRPLEAA